MRCRLSLDDYLGCQLYGVIPGLRWVCYGAQRPLGFTGKSAKVDHQCTPSPWVLTELSSLADCETTRHRDMSPGVISTMEPVVEYWFWRFNSRAVFQLPRDDLQAE